MGAKKATNDWFQQLPPEKQMEYCSRLQGKKRSKYCTIDGKPKVSKIKGLVKAEDPKVIFDPEGQGVMNFSYEEDSKQLSLGEKESASAIDQTSNKSPEIVIPELKEALKEAGHDYYDRESEFVWAKKAQIGNIGEDVGGSARHKKNQHKDWNSEEAFTNLDMKINKEILEEQNSPDFESLADEDLAKGFAMRMCLDEFPSTIPHEKGIETNEAKLARRKMYIDSYNAYVDKIDEQLSDPNISSYQALRNIKDFLAAKSNQFRALPHGSLIGESFDKKRNKIMSGKNGPYDLLHKSYKAARDIDPVNCAQAVSSGADGRPESPDFKKGLKSNDNVKKLYKNLIAKTESLKPEKKTKKNGFEERGIYSENKSYSIKGNGYKVNSEKDAVNFFKNNTRAVQFGNALPDKEREAHLVSCARSLEDLSKLTGLSVKSLTQDGKLAFGFSARGRAGAAAHYDNGTKIINLTRANGFGSLAHELGHALDSKASSKKGITGNYASESKAYPSYEPVSAVVEKIKSRIKKSPEYRFMSPKQRQYWTSTREVFARVFEAHVDAKAKKAGIDNSYLVQITKNQKLSTLWPNEAELKELESPLENYLKDIDKG